MESESQRISPTSVLPGVPWASDLDSDASDVLDGELRLGYLVPPDGPDASFAAAVRHWHAVGVESGVFKGDGAVEVPSLLLEQERLRQRRARLSGSRSRSRSRSRSQSVPRRREDDKTHVVPDAVAEEAAGAGKEEDGIAHRSTSGGTDDIANDSQTSTAKKGAEEAPKSRMDLRHRLAQLVVDLTLKGWDLRLNNRMRILIPSAIMFCSSLAANVTAHMEEFACKSLETQGRWVSATGMPCATAAHFNIAFIVWNTAVDLLRILLAAVPRTLPLAIRWNPWLTVAQFIVIGAYHGFAVMGGVLTMLIPIHPPPALYNKASAMVFQFCSSLVVMGIGCTLWINTGEYMPAWVEWTLVFLIGLPYAIMLTWFCSVLPSFLPRMPPGFQTCTDADYLGAALAFVIFPATYYVFSKIFHGGTLSQVNKPVTSPIDRSEGLYRAAFGIVLCAVFYVVGMLVAMYTLLLPPEGRHMSPMEALFLSPFMRSLFIVVAAPMASMVMRSATEISQCSRDIILAEILPKDAALAVLGNVTRAELVGKKQAQDADLAGGSMDGSSRVTPIPSSVETSAGSVRYMKQVGRVAAVAVDVPELSRLLATHDVAACVDLAHKVDVLVDAILDRSRARRIESGSPSMVLAVVNAEGGVADPEEKGLIIAEALHLGLLDLSSDPSSASLLSQSRTLRCRAAVASCDAAVVVTGVKRPNLRVLGPIQAVQGILGTVTPGQLCVSARAFQDAGGGHQGDGHAAVGVHEGQAIGDGVHAAAGAGAHGAHRRQGRTGPLHER